MWTTLQSPTFCSSWAKKVLIESAVPVYSVYVPCSRPGVFTLNVPAPFPEQSEKPETVWEFWTVAW